MRQLAGTPSALTEPFWDHAAAHRLVIPRCARTGVYFFPPERCVPGTADTDWTYTEVAGTGTVYSFTVVHRAPAPQFDAPYVVAVIDLDEGVTLMSNIVGVDPDDISIGLRVRVTYLDVADGRALPVFTSIATPPTI